MMYLVGVLGILQGSLQLLAGLGRVELDFWPFVKTPSRSLRLAASAASFAFGLVALVIAVAQGRG